MSRAFTLAALITLTLPGCDSAPPSDAGPGASVDAGADAALPLDAALADDAGEPPTDAGLGADAAGPMDAGSDAADAGPPRTSAEICMSICDRLAACGFGGPSEAARCNRDCTTDLSDCDASQLIQADACHREPDACMLTGVDGPPKVLECVMRLSCVMG